MKEPWLLSVGSVCGRHDRPIGDKRTAATGVVMDSTIPRTFLDDEENTPDAVQAMIPYWVYTRICAVLNFTDTSIKPEDQVLLT